jgi:septin family protein
MSRSGYVSVVLLVIDQATNFGPQNMIPFAVVGSERNVIIDGKSVRGRKNRWGVVNVESEQHCEFMDLRNFLTRCVLVYSSCWPLF